MSEVLMPCGEPAAGDCIAATRQWLERAVHRKQQIRYAVTAARTADELLAELAHELEILSTADAGVIDTTLLIHPQVMSGFLDYRFFLDEANAAVRNLGFDGVFQIASLHPLYEFAGSAPDDIDNYSNRAPHPTLHLLREASIDRAVAAFPDAAAIFDKNIATLRRLGHAGWQQLWTHKP